MSNFLIARANTLMFGVFLLVLLVIAGLTLEQFRTGAEARRWADRTFEVISQVKDLDIAVGDAESTQRAYVLTGQEEYLRPYREAVDRVGVMLRKLNASAGGNDRQQQRLQTLTPLIQRRMDGMTRTVQVRQESGLEAATARVLSGGGRILALQIDEVLSSLSSDQQALLAARQGEAASRGRWVLGLVIAGGVIAAGGLLTAARMLNQAWHRSSRAEARQRSLALQLRASLDSLSQGVGVFSAGRILVNWNDCFRALLDMPRAMMRAGTPYAAIAEHALQAGLELETEAQLTHGHNRPGEAVLYEHTAGDGRVLELRRTSTPDGGFVLTVSDMTKRAEAEGLLREAQKMQAIGQLTGGIAHDFNNLLTVILGNLEILQKKLAGQAALQTRIERAVWAAGRGATLTAQLLSFARKQPLAPTPIDLGASMPDLVPLLRRTLGEHIDVRYVESAGLWPAMADPAQLESAVLNLALNARDAMPGGGRLTIELTNKVLDAEYARAHTELSPGDYTVVAVSDTGHGMTKEVAARVFEPFFTTKPNGKGTGLGLAMVFGFVKQSGGHVKIYSEPGEGTTVRIYLPRAVGAVAGRGSRVGAPIELPGGSATILVVEDEPTVREIAVAILSDLGYRVLEAGDGEEGLVTFGQHASKIDLLLTDVVLPGPVRGRELAERILAIRPDMRVLYMSGYTENSIVHHGRLDDGVQLLSKPFRRDELAHKVASALKGWAPQIQAALDGNVIPLSKAKRSD